MTGSERIVSSSSVTGQPILVSGQPTMALYDTLISECRRRDPSADLSIFAEPVMASDGGTVDWYGEPGSDGFVPWSALSEEQKTQAGQKLYAAVASIRSVKDGIDTNFDKLIDSALHIPDENDIVVSDGRPLLVRWGMTSQGGVFEESVLDRVLTDSRVVLPPDLPVDEGPNEELDMVFRRIRRDAPVSALLLSTTMTFLLLTASGLLMLQHCGLALPRFIAGEPIVMLADFCPNERILYNPETELLERLEREARVIADHLPHTEDPVSPSGSIQEQIGEEGMVTEELDKAVQEGIVELVKLKIYDNNSEDGDEVLITAPGYSRKITLTNEGAIFNVPLVHGEMILTGLYDGGGGVTVSVALTDGTHIVDGRMEVGEEINLTIPTQ